MKIYLIRHGQSTSDIVDRFGGDYDDHLTNLGKEQAKSLSVQLKDKGIEVIYTSPKIRAQETANVLAHELGVKLKIIKNLRERNAYGPLTGMIKSEAKEKYPDLVRDLKIKTGTIKGAELYSDFKKRVLEDIYRLANGKYSTAAIVTHGGPISCFFREVLKIEIKKLDDCAIVELEKIQGDFKLVSIKGVKL